MSLDDYSNEKNEFEDQLEEIKEWQDNMYNPGHYIGTGKIPYPLKSIFKYPIILIIIGIMGAVPPLLGIILNGFSPLSVIFLIFFSILIYGGIRRIIISRK